jgi:acyl carrier protein
MLRPVAGRAPRSEVSLGDADSASRVVEEPSDLHGPDEADGVARRLVWFVNTHVMARSRPIQPDDELEAAGVDSMGLLKILLFVEAEFGFWMPDADLRTENVSSLRRLAGYVSRRMTLA